MNKKKAIIITSILAILLIILVILLVPTSVFPIISGICVGNVLGYKMVDFYNWLTKTKI